MKEKTYVAVEEILNICHSKLLLKQSFQSDTHLEALKYGCSFAIKTHCTSFADRSAGCINQIFFQHMSEKGFKGQ